MTNETLDIDEEVEELAAEISKIMGEKKADLNVCTYALIDLLADSIRQGESVVGDRKMTFNTVVKCVGCWG